MTVSEVARQLGVDNPRRISDLLYQRRLPVDEIPLRSGRRFIPSALLPAIAIELRRAGYLPRLSA